MTREEAITWLKAVRESTLIYGENEEAIDVAIEALSAEPKWNCTATFIAEQLEKFNEMPQGEKIAFIKRFFGIVDKESKVDNAKNLKCDLISREEAMNTVWNEAKEYEKEFMVSEDSEDYSHDVGYLSGMHRAKLILKLMPSVSAERIKAEKDCRNCKYGKWNDHFNNYYCYNPKNCTDWDLWESEECVLAERSGEWLQEEHKDYKCSVCGAEQWDDTDYCPSCGARMENK